MIDYKKTYFVKKHEFAMPIVTEGLAENIPQISTKIMSSMPLYNHLLFNVNLVFHIKAEEDILEKIYQALTYNKDFLSLGRHEDLLRIDAIDYVSLEETEDCCLQHAVYIPESYIEEDERGLGIPYLLNWTYKVKQGIREWERIPTIYVKENHQLDIMEVNTIQIDDQGYPVFWNK